jgi:hypothetical protein
LTVDCCGLMVDQRKIPSGELLNQQSTINNQESRIKNQK